MRASVVASLIGVAAVVSACVARQPDTVARNAAAHAFSDSVLANLTYPAPLPGHGHVTLRSGEWEGDTTVLGRQRVSRILSARGQLMEGRPGAAVVLLTEPGATGRFFDLVPVYATVVGARAGRATALGDRIRPESLWVAEGRVFLRLVTHDSADGLCCPTRRELQRFRMLGADSLALEEHTLVERIPPDAGGA